MRILEPKDFYRQSTKRKRRAPKHWRVLIVSLVLVAVTSYSVHLYRRPLPTLIPKTTTISVQPGKIKLDWPEAGQAAIGALDYGVLASNGEQKAAPMASTAKVMTALAVLRKKPLAAGQQGPILTLTADDVSLFEDYVARGGSYVTVNEGEEISEYQALQALMLPSANNIADTLAIWTFGSMDNYLGYANDLAAKLGLSNTHLADASGFSPETVSSASDLVLLGQAAMREPALAEIVGQASVAGNVDNVNKLLGQDGIIGIKTGNTDEAGGCYIFAAKHTYDDKQAVTVIGAFMGASSLKEAFIATKPLLASSVQNFVKTTVIKRGQLIGQYHLPWGGTVAAVAERDISMFGWNGDGTKVTSKLNTLARPQNSKSIVGAVIVQTREGPKKVSAVLNNDAPSPGLRWRLWRD